MKTLVDRWRARLRAGRGLLGAVVVAAFCVVPVHAAKNPDKPFDKPFDKPAKVEKYERKLERAGMAESPVIAQPRQTMGQPAGAPAKADRPSKAERAERERAERSERAESADRAASAALPADGKFDAFRVIVDRNIFNPNRNPRTRSAPEEKPPQVEEISLVGTLQYDKGLIAFFDSSAAEFRKNLREGDSIAGFKIRRILADGVELVRDDQPLSLRVAQQLRRREGGDWTVSAAPARVDARGPEASRAATEAAAAELPADASEALKRLLEKRKQQLSK